MPVLVNCPSCERKLRVPDDLLGQKVKCPTCATTFDAVTAPAAVPPAPEPSLPPEPPAFPQPEPPPQPTLYDQAAPPETAKDAPPPEAPASALPPAKADDLRPCPYCGERIPTKATRCRHCDEDLDEEDDDDDEGDERPWERGHPAMVRRDCEPHRGGLVLTLGIISVVAFGICGPVGLPLGIAAWVMGQRDLRKIREKSMDPQGQGLTQAGWICGIIGTILDGLMSLGCVAYLGFIVFIGMSAAGAAKNSQPPMQMKQPAAPKPALPMKKDEPDKGPAIPSPKDDDDDKEQG